MSDELWYNLRIDASKFPTISVRRLFGWSRIGYRWKAGPRTGVTVTMTAALRRATFEAVDIASTVQRFEP